MMTQTFSQIKSLLVIQLLAEAVWRDYQYERWRNTLFQLNALLMDFTDLSIKKRMIYRWFPLKEFNYKQILTMR